MGRPEIRDYQDEHSYRWGAYSEAMKVYCNALEAQLEAEQESVNEFSIANQDLELRLQCKDCGRSDGHEEGCSGAIDWEAAALSLEARLKRAEEELSDLRWRRRDPYGAFLSDAAKRDNCGNCVNNKGRCDPPNSDRIKCHFPEGWPHWTAKCKHWKIREALKGLGKEWKENGKTGD